MLPHCVQVFVHRVRKYLGAYMVHLRGRVDAIVFSAGMGENSAYIRQHALSDLEVGHTLLDSEKTDWFLKVKNPLLPSIHHLQSSLQVCTS